MAGTTPQATPAPDPMSVPLNPGTFVVISRSGAETELQVERKLVQKENGFRYEGAQDFGLDSEDADLALIGMTCRFRDLDGNVVTLKAGKVHPSQRSGNSTVLHSATATIGGILYNVRVQATAKLRNGEPIINVRPKAFRASTGGGSTFEPIGTMTGAAKL